MAAAGCYRYQQITPASITPGQTVRTRLNAEGMVRLEPFFGEPQRQVVGEVVESGSGQLLLLTRGRMPMGAMPDDRLRQRLVIEQREIVDIEQRSLDRQRTSVVVGALTASAAAVLYHFLTGQSRGQQAEAPPEGPAMMRVRGN
jgi:hypothetical protein